MNPDLPTYRQIFWIWTAPQVFVLIVAIVAARWLEHPAFMFLPAAVYLLCEIGFGLAMTRAQGDEVRNGMSGSLHDTQVNGLPLPPLLVELISSGRWQHPGDEVVRAAIPFLNGPVDFLQFDEMKRESRGTLADHPLSSKAFHELRGRHCPTPVELPWLDVDKAVFIAANRIHGGDLAIVLDYRKDPDDPRVVANEWLAPGSGCIWREVAPNFGRFARMMQWCSAAT